MFWLPSSMSNAFAWPQLKKVVTQYIQHCDICQRAETKLASTWLLDPHNSPPHLWHTIDWNFVECCPKSNGMDVIPVMIDKLMNCGHFLHIKHPFKTQQVAQIFFDQVYRLHGMPFRIIPYRGLIFTGAFCQELFQLSDTVLNMSSSRPPKAYGQT